MKSHLSNILIVAGAACIAAGIYLLLPSAGLVAAGIFLLLGGVATARVEAQSMKTKITEALARR